MKIHPIAVASAAVLAVPSPAHADHVAASATSQGGGIITFAPDTLDKGMWSAGLRFSYTRPEQRPDEELEALAARHIHAHNSDDNLDASISLAYGITHHLTLSATLPYVRRDSLREGTHSHVGGVAVNEVEQLGSVAGIGDMSLIAKYRLTDGEGPGLALVGGVKLPTGSTHRRSSDGERLETEHQPGTGSVDPIAGVSLALPLGKARLTASALYQKSGRGAQHTRLGDRLQGGIALSTRFIGPSEAHEEAEMHHHDEGEDDMPHAHGHESLEGFVELAGEREGRQRVDGGIEADSGGRWLWLTPGLRYTSASGWSTAGGVSLAVAQHIRPSHPDQKMRLTFSIGRAF